ncbi:inverse autotransporter beta domain-containing protein [Orbaceae bacterium ac157xtp]
MKRYLNLSIIATFVIATLSTQVASAKTAQSSSAKKEGITSTSKADDNLRVFVNNQQRSLYQIALLSGISVSELRELNKGDYDKVDIVKVGDSIVLPATSPLLPAEKVEVKKEDKYSNLPSLGSSDKVEVKSNDEIIETQVATVLQTMGQLDWGDMTSDKVKEDLKNKSQSYTENYVRNQVNQQVIDPVRSAAQDFLGRFGTAQLQFDVSDQGRLNNLNVKLFSPWYDSDDMLLFSQLTYQEYEKDRRIGNFGIGQRWDVADKSWLLGYNVFFDHDFSRDHNRLGLGVEAWADYMKLAANYYMPLSDWKDSKDFDDYLERAARGFDVRFQGYLPSYPHLGGSLMFEQYFGDKVALFGKDNLQKDPYAVTVGVDYTPVPLFTIKGEHKQGQDSNKAAKVELTMNYRLGVPLSDQLDANMVDVARSLKGSRYDLVDRNNFIVLEYKDKKFSVDLFLLDPVTGKPRVDFYEDTIVPVKLAFHNAKGDIDIEWASNELFNPASPFGGDLCFGRSLSAPLGTQCNTANGEIKWTLASPSVNDTPANHSAGWSVLVPKYIDVATGDPNTIAYDLSVKAKDGQNKESNSIVQMKVLPEQSRKAVVENDSTTNPSGDKWGASAAPAPLNQTVKLVAHLDKNGTGFNDSTIRASYPNFTGGAAVDIEAVKKVWKITKNSDGKEVKLVDGGASGATCGQEECIIVQSIQPVPGSLDKYEIEITTDKTPGDIIKVKPTLAPYGSNDISVYFQTVRAIAMLEITDDTGATQTVPMSGSGPHTFSGTPQVGREYTVKLLDAGSANVTSDYTVTWSLIGDNVSACPGANTVLPNGSSVNTLFAVVQDAYATQSSYTIRNNSTSYASSGTYESPVNSGVFASPRACAGDQGFKLRLDIE